MRLTQGRADQETRYSDDPVAVAAGFQREGAVWIHVVDLDGAFSGEPANLPIVGRIAALGLRVQFGGGLRSLASVERARGAGVSRVVLGTRAARSDGFIAELVASHGERIAVGIDAKDGRVAVRGWVDTTETSALELARRMDSLGVSTLIHTDIGTDGTLSGPNLKAQEAMLGTVSCRLIASGGIGSRDDVAALARLSLRGSLLEGVIVGKALYEGRVGLAELLAAAG